MMERHPYCIIAHNYPDQLAVLVNALSDERNTIFIHIDKKTKIEPFIKCVTNVNSNVKFIKKRKKVYWGHSSQIEAELNLLEAVDNEKEAFSRIHLISGVDFPLKSQNEIHDYFLKHKTEEFIDFPPMILIESFFAATLNTHTILVSTSRKKGC